MKLVPFGMVGVAAATALLIFSQTLRAQGDGEPAAVVSRAISAIVDYGNDAVFEPAKHGTDFDRLGVLPQQVLTITVQFPVELAGQFMIADPLDGGSTTVPEDGLIVDNDGKVTFQFDAPNAFGACRIAVHRPDDSNFIQLWVADSDHPENIPPDLPGVY